MGIWNSLFGPSKTRENKRRKPSMRLRDRSKRGRSKQRGLRMEQFEERMLLSIEPPSLVVVIPNVSQTDGHQYLTDGGKFAKAPTELLLRFNVGQTIDTNSLATGIQLVRSGGDGKSLHCQRAAAAAAERRVDRRGFCETVDAQPHFTGCRDEFPAEMADWREEKADKRFQWIDEHRVAATGPTPR